MYKQTLYFFITTPRIRFKVFANFLRTTFDRPRINNDVTNGNTLLSYDILYFDQQNGAISYLLLP